MTKKNLNNSILMGGDTLYEMTKEYLEGAEAMRERIPYTANPYRSGSRRADDWENGHVHESGHEHVRFGIDLLKAPRTGRLFEEDGDVPRDEDHNVNKEWYERALAGATPVETVKRGAKP